MKESELQRIHEEFKELEIELLKREAILKKAREEKRVLTDEEKVKLKTSPKDDDKTKDRLVQLIIEDINKTEIGKIETFENHDLIKFLKNYPTELKKVHIKPIIEKALIQISLEE